MKVLDFGLARLTSSAESAGARLTLTGTLMGTPAYMSPEQLRGSEPPAPPPDIFALGLLLHEMLTGQHAFGVAGRRADGRRWRASWKREPNPLPVAVTAAWPGLARSDWPMPDEGSFRPLQQDAGRGGCAPACRPADVFVQRQR